jgi:hypothetical protein
LPRVLFAVRRHVACSFLWRGCLVLAALLVHPRACPLLSF